LGLRTLLFIGLFLLCTFGAFNVPLLGVLGYVAHNLIGPERQWWAIPIRGLGIRYSLTLGVVTAAGLALNWHRLRPNGPLLIRQEKLMLLLLSLVWLSSFVGETFADQHSDVDPPAIKLTKALIFVLMFTHIVIDLKSLNRVFWVMIIATFLVSLQAYGKPRSDFVGGRLEGVGGVDFAEANFLGGFLVTMLPIIGIQFLRSARLGKAVCLVTGVFACNAIVLTRSRGAFAAAGFAAVAALFCAPKKYRLVILLGVIVAAIGSYRLMDEQFLQRMSTITRAEEERDRSAQSRLEVWRGGMKMMWANPFGVGPGNYVHCIGRYDPRNAGRDAHNMFVRCAGEIGLPGLLVLLALVVNAATTLRAVSARSAELPEDQCESVRLILLAMWGSLAAVVGVSMTITLLYVENTWWFLALPVCASRIVDNCLLADAKEKEWAPPTLISCVGEHERPVA
jgi:putative inorganic carbon (hco3(-)) transporter